MARRRRSRDDLLEAAEDADEGSLRAERRPRWGRRFLLFVALIVALAAFAPLIVSKTPVVGWLLAQSLPADVARLTCSGASLSWTGSQTLAGMQLFDGAGQPLFGADAVTLDRSLVSLLADHRNLGRLVLVRPVARVETQGGRTNFEELAARLQEKSLQAAGTAANPAAGAPVTFTEIEIVDGTVFGRDAASGQQWGVRQLSGIVKPAAGATGWEASGAGALELAAAAAAGPPGTAPAGTPLAADAGRFKFQFGPLPEGGQRLELIADCLPLAPLEPFLAQQLPGAKLAGFASADMKVRIGASAPNQSAVIAAAGKIDAADVRFTANALRGDVVELGKSSLALDATIAGGQFTARQFDVRGDWVQANVVGDFDGQELAALSAKALPRRDATITAKVDLPKLAAMLPRTLGLRPGVRIDAGTLELTAKSAETDGRRRWTIATAVDRLIGTDGERPIRWTQPVEAGVDLAEYSGAPQWERFILRTPFASAAAEAEADGFAGTLEFNLGELGRELGQLVDLSALQLAGAAKGKFMVRPGDGDSFAATAELDLAEVDVRQSGRTVWSDPQLHVEAKAAGVRRGFAPTRFDSLEVGMRGPSDLVSLSLAEPVAVGLTDQLWALNVAGEGPLESWAGRLRPWIAGMPEELSGQAKLSVKMRARPGFIEATESTLGVDQFRMRRGTIAIAEPRLEAGGDFRWDGAAGSVDSQTMQVSTTTLAARARNISVRTNLTGPPALRGEVALRGDLARLSSWGLGGAGADQLNPRGQAVGRLQLASDPQSATATLSGTVESFELVRGDPLAPPTPATLAWSEPKLELAADVRYTAEGDRLELTTARLTGRTLQLAGAGVIEQLRGEGLARGEANVAYDSVELAKLLTTYFGPNVRFDGANQAKIAVSGRLHPSGLAAFDVSSNTDPASGIPYPAPGLPPHWSRNWQGTSETGWTAANVYGLPLGPTRVVGNLREGQLTFNPIEAAVGQGKLTIQPRVIFDPAPARLQLAPGPVATNIDISAQASEQMLKFAAPIIAGATRAEGSFSAFIDGFETPLANTRQIRASGRLTIHRLSLLPGPMIQDVVNLLGQIEAVGKGQPLGVIAPKQVKGVTMTERTIDVQVVDGRVYHRNLEFMVDDVPVRSYGSVGFDETLALVIEIPIQQKWVGSKLQSLVGQNIQIPIQGTFSKPQVDNRAIAQLSTQLVQGAAQGVIGEELNKAFDKLFKPRK